MPQYLQDCNFLEWSKVSLSSADTSMAPKLDLNSNIVMIYGHLDSLFQLKLLKRMTTLKVMKANLSLWNQQVISGRAWTWTSYYKNKKILLVSVVSWVTYPCIVQRKKLTGQILVLLSVTPKDKNFRSSVKISDQISSIFFFQIMIILKDQDTTFFEETSFKTEQSLSNLQVISVLLALLIRLIDRQWILFPMK